MDEKKQELKIKNLLALQGKRPDASFYKNLDSSIKKNSALVKRIRSFSEYPNDQRISILQDIQKVNLTRYISEIVQTFSQIPLKMDDVDFVVELASNLHQLYSEFSETFITTIVKSCAIQKEGTNQKELNIQRLHIVLFIITKLFILKMHEDFNTIFSLLKGLITKNKKISQSGILMSFLKEFAKDLKIGKFKNDESIEVILKEQEEKQLRELFMGFYESLCNKLRVHLKMDDSTSSVGQQQEGVSSPTLMENTTGESTTANNAEEKEEKKISKKWKKYFDVVKEASDVLNVSIPNDINEKLQQVTTNEEQENTSTSTTDGRQNVNNEKDQNENVNNIDLFVNEKTRQFYQDIPDINVLILDKNNELDNINTLEDLFDRLTKRPPVNKVAATFVLKFGNLKNNRTRLVKKMFGVHRTSLELLPYYSRLVAILNNLYKDMGKLLVQLLEEEFNKLFEEQDQIKIETKVKNIRFLGELILFGICPEELGIQLLRNCLSQFHHHNIDVTCHFLEVCGRYLYVKSNTHNDIVDLITKMLRIKDVKLLDPKYNTMIESAYYNTVIFNNTEKSKNFTNNATVTNDELIQYVLHLLFNELNKYNFNFILKQLRKLPFDDHERMKQLIKCILNHIRECAYGTIHLIASLLSSLSVHHEQIGILIIDNLIEEIRFSLQQEYLDMIEYNQQFKSNNITTTREEQKRVIDIKFLGEFYNYQLIDVNIILDVLYMLILYPKLMLPSQQDTFRIRLVCVLLDTCGPYFETANDRKKLDRFLFYLQRYILSRQYRLPVDLENMLADTLDLIRPKLKWPKDLKEINDKIDLIEQQQKYVPLPGLPNGKSSLSVNITNNGLITNVSEVINSLEDIGNGLMLWPVLDQQQENDGNLDNEEDGFEEDINDDISSNNNNLNNNNSDEIDDLDKELAEMINESISERKFIVNTNVKLGNVKELLTNASPVKKPILKSIGPHSTVERSNNENKAPPKLTLVTKQGRNAKAIDLFIEPVKTKDEENDDYDDNK
ncbi:hypothetical protein ABK040_004748 [Willaertia magna]